MEKQEDAGAASESGLTIDSPNNPWLAMTDLPQQCSHEARSLHPGLWGHCNSC